MDLKQRRRYVRLVDTVRESCGDVRIFSSLHVSGERKIIINFLKLQHFKLLVHVFGRFYFMRLFSTFHMYKLKARTLYPLQILVPSLNLQ